MLIPVIDTYSQVLNVWKQVSQTILGSKIFLGLVALGNRYAVCKGYGITTSFEPACRVHDYFIPKIDVKNNKAA